jgi:hypothetical protein
MEDGEGLLGREGPTRDGLSSEHRQDLATHLRADAEGKPLLDKPLYGVDRQAATITLVSTNTGLTAIVAVELATTQIATDPTSPAPKNRGPEVHGWRPQSGSWARFWLRPLRPHAPGHQATSGLLRARFHPFSVPERSR